MALTLKQMFRKVVDNVSGRAGATGRPGPAPRPSQPAQPSQTSQQGDQENPGRTGPTATVEVRAEAVGAVRTAYDPKKDGDPDPGEIVWTWVPYEENDGRGKDRPVLVVAREGNGTVLAVQLSSKQHNQERDWVAIGTGGWDREGRESWVAVDRLLRVHPGGMRREAAILDRPRFGKVEERLKERYGWK